MPKRAQQRADLKAVPLLKNESLYVGIDIGKAKHVAGFLSRPCWSAMAGLKPVPPMCLKTPARGSED